MDSRIHIGYEYACKLDVPMSAGSDIHFFYDGAKGGMMFDRRLTSIEDYIDAMQLMDIEDILEECDQEEYRNVYDIFTEYRMYYQQEND